MSWPRACAAACRWLLRDLVNVFDAHVRETVASVGGAMALCRDAGLATFACGSGPGFFSPMPFEDLPPILAHELEHDWGVRAIACRTLGRAEASRLSERCSCLKSSPVSSPATVSP